MKFTPEVWPTNNVVTFTPSTTPPDLPVTAVKIYIFKDSALLMAKVLGRGWDLPGGHLEDGETPAQAVVRELKEETGASVASFDLIGYLDIKNNGPSRRGTKYPPHSCILIYKGAGVSFDTTHKFPHLEVTEANFISLKDLPKLHNSWNESKKQVVDFAQAA